jgi:hypothetical protein
MNRRGAQLSGEKAGAALGMLLHCQGIFLIQLRNDARRQGGPV